MKIPTICYKTKEPIYYNKGTKYESSCDTFLFKYVYGDIFQVRQELMRLNALLDNGVEKHNGEDFTKIAFFYIDEQEEMY